ncbi:MAG: sugar phosphate nucleotidyltransferase [Vulcanimicrobiota bacterium]
MVKAIIPSAGFGTRLLPFTKEKPKPLFPVMNHPIMELIINILGNAGIRQIGINLHHLSRQIEDFFIGKSFTDTKFYFSKEKIIMNTGGGIAGFKDFLSDTDDFIVHNSDILHNLNLDEILTFHRSRGQLATMVLVDNPPGNRVMVGENFKVVDIAGKLGRKFTSSYELYHGGGIFLYNRKIFDYFPTHRQPFSIIPVLLELVKTRPGSVLAYVAPKKSYWKDMGNLASYLDLHRDLLSRKIISFPGLPEVKGSVSVGENTEIPPDLNQKGFLCVGNNVRINSRVVLEDCVIWDDVEISSRCKFINSLISPSNLVGERVECTYRKI